MTAQAKFEHKRVKRITGASKKQGRRCIWGQKDPRNVKKSDTHATHVVKQKDDGPSKLERKRVKHIAGANKKKVGDVSGTKRPNKC